MRSLVLALSLAVLPVGLSHAAEPTTPRASTPEAAKPKCEHGVQKTLCTRCNPKLAAVYKKKGDWCAEHDRPESQCSICHPELAKQGVKP